MDTKHGLLNVFLGLLKIDKNGTIGVTLFVNGLTISGDLIGPIRYFKEIAVSLQNSTQGNPEFAVTMADAITNTLRRIENDSNIDLKKEKSDNITIDLDEPGVLYFKDVTIHNSSGNVQLKSPCSIRIDSIDGFILGRFG